MKLQKLLPIILVLAVVLGLWVFGGDQDIARQSSPPSNPGVAVEIAPVETRPIRDVAEYTGSLEPAHRFNLSPKVGGRLQELRVDIGDRVERGQVVARLDDSEFVQAVAESRAALDVAEAQLEDARAMRTVREREFRRLQNLREQGLASESEFDVGRAEFEAARAGVAVAEAQVAQRRATLEAAELRRSHTTVRAEWSDSEADVRYVGERFVDEGANVPANEAIVSLIDTASLKAVTSVVDRDFARLRQGQPVAIRSEAWPGEVFDGRVARIAPLLQEATRQARIEIEVPNEDGRLSPGFFVTLRIQVEEIPDARVVPIDAISRFAGEEGVYQVVEASSEEEQPTARFVPVTVGVTTETHAQIIEPELEGRVVTLGQHRLGTGTPLRIANGD